MNLVINLQALQQFFSLPPDVMLWRFMGYYGWIIISIMFLFSVREMWLLYVQTKFVSKVKYLMLAIDIPRANVQSPRAVENLLAYLAGAHGTINWFEKWWEGKCQVFFSFEIVSIDGYTQFLIRTPVDFRNLVETGVYSQYPDAEITEVDDYTEGAPTKFPNEEYDVWGAEFIQSAPKMFPIKMYKEFEHQLGPDETYYKDPMASLMDLCSSLQPGEQLWYQILIIPTGFDWVKDAESEIDKIVGKKAKVSLVNSLIDSTVEGISDLSESVYSIWGDVKPKPEKEFKALSMMELRPKQKKQIEGLHMKVSKLGFLAKIRFVYLAKKEVYNPKKVASGFVGYIKQFAALDLNSFKPDLDKTGTSTAYFHKVKRLNDRKRRIVQNYVNRSGEGGRYPSIYNIEELASIWHFPIEASVSAPLIQKTPGKKAKPPMSLPSEETIIYHDVLEPIYSLEESASNQSEETPSALPVENSPLKTEPDVETAKRGSAPSNLPFA
jgi:hypothetical protein